MRLGMPLLAPSAISLLIVAGCASAPSPEPPSATIAVVAQPSEPGWGEIIRDEDRARLRTLPAIWGVASAAVERSAPAAYRREQSLIDSGAALGHPALPPGAYRCRTVRIGAAARGGPSLQIFRSFFCHVQADGERLTFVKQTGTDLPAGWLFPDGGRYVFLGTRLSHGEPGSIGYGHAGVENLVGIVERIGDFRWRLVLPAIDRENGVDLYELLPVIQSVHVESRP